MKFNYTFYNYLFRICNSILNIKKAHIIFPGLVLRPACLLCSLKAAASNSRLIYMPETQRKLQLTTIKSVSLFEMRYNSTKAIGELFL